MRIKKFSIVSSAVLLSGLFFMAPVWAASGNLTIRAKDISSIAMVKVADMVDGEFEICSPFQDAKVKLNHLEDAEQLNRAAEKLSKIEADSDIYMIKDASLKIENLSPGVYLIFDSDATDNKDIMPSLVQVPMQDKENGEMLYEIEVYPKYVQVSESSIPKTGDGSNIVLYTALILGSLVVIFLLAFVFFLPVIF